MRIALGLRVCALVSALACDDSDPPPVVGHTPADAGADGDSSVDEAGSDDANGTTDADAGRRDSGRPAPCDDTEGPVVTILEPEAATDPNTDPVVTSSVLTVHCRAEAPPTSDAVPVATESVQISRLNAYGGAVDIGAVVIEGADEYSAAFDVSAVANGLLRFGCEAEDLRHRCNRAVVQTFIDHGPDLAVVTPEPNSTHGSAIDVVYRVSAAPLADGDTLATVASTELVVVGATIVASEGSTAGEYHAEVDFEDLTLFPTPVTGVNELSVRAINDRGAEARIALSFIVDSEGPEIVFVEPDPGGAQLAGGLTRVKVTVTDPAGVSNVVLRMAAETSPMTFDTTEGAYVLTFDAAAFPNSMTELTLNVTATDSVGNVSTRSNTVKLDSVPPVVDLNPPEVFEYYVDPNHGDVCGEPFDPVGDDSVDDGEVVGTAAEFRLRTRDRTNGAVGGENVLLPYADLDPTSVKLYILDDVTVPLLVDDDADGYCDSINPVVEPAPGVFGTAIVINLVALAPAGLSFFPEAAARPDTMCADWGPDRTRPLELCEFTSPLTRIISRTFPPADPTIFAKPPVGGQRCAGDIWDFQASVSEGWACIAATADDNLGNRGLSPPLRVCFDNGVPTDGEPCGASIGDPPNCNPGCTAPAGYSAYGSGPQPVRTTH